MRLLFCGGGTGGHLFPGIALAERRDVGSVHFLCTPRALDRSELGRRGFPFTPVGRWEIRKAVRTVQFFAPDVAVMLGGGGAIPGLLASAALRLPYVCLEQNVVPGRLTRLAARGARRLYAQWRESRRYLGGTNGRFVWAGSPLRKLPFRDAGEARRRYALDPDRPTILVLGGSQGSEAINRRLPEWAGALPGPVQFLHLAGVDKGADEVRTGYRSAGVPASVLEFEPEMEWAYSAADAAVARAGAITLAELCRFRIPALLIPYPHAKDDHQAANALALARAGAAWAVRQEGFRREILRAWGEALVSGNEILDNMREALAAFDRPGAEDFILRDLRERIAS